MKQYLIPVTLAGALTLTATVAGQTPPPTAPATAQKPAPTAAGAVTVEGCLMREDDVPRRKSNVAERVGVGEETLKRPVNRRVQVDGTFESLDRGMKGDALIEIRATGIRPVSGDCPPK